MFKVGDKVPHVHAEIIKAWADGATIQIYRKVDEGDDDEYEWVDCPAPSFLVAHKYRVKPEPKPDAVFYGVAVMEVGGARVFCLGPVNARPDNNIKLTFDGETGKLKAVELI